MIFLFGDEKIKIIRKRNYYIWNIYWKFACVKVFCPCSVCTTSHFFIRTMYLDTICTMINSLNLAIKDFYCLSIKIVDFLICKLITLMTVMLTSLSVTIGMLHELSWWSWSSNFVDKILEILLLFCFIELQCCNQWNLV